MRGGSASRRISTVAAVVGALGLAALVAPPADAAPDHTKPAAPQGIPYDELSPIAPEFRLVAQWPRTNLTYSFGAGTADIPGDGERDAVRLAFNLWEEKSTLRFTEVPSGGDILIFWATGNHGDVPFGSGVLAHAFYPQNGDAHFNDAYTWDGTLPLSSGAVDLVTIAAHEFGHSIGIDHSDDGDAIMYPYYSGPHRYLGEDDINAVQFLYGNGTPVPQPKLSIGDVTVAEPARGRTNARFDITLSSPATTTTKVKWQTEDATATAKADYGSKAGTVTIKKGKTSAHVSVRVKHDAVDEPTETFRVVLHSPTNAEIDDGTGIGTILDAG